MPWLHGHIQRFLEKNFIFSKSKAWCSEMAMLLIRATKLCRKSIRREGCLRHQKNDFRPKLGFLELKKNYPSPQSKIQKTCFSDIQIDPLMICFPGHEKKERKHWRQDTRECLVHFCDKDCPVTPDFLEIEEKTWKVWPKKTSWPAMWRHHLAISPIYLSISAVFETPHESFLCPRTHPKKCPMAC